jgi:hypothetical protein
LVTPCGGTTYFLLDPLPKSEFLPLSFVVWVFFSIMTFYRFLFSIVTGIIANLLEEYGNSFFNLTGFSSMPFFKTLL